MPCGVCVLAPLAALGLGGSAASTFLNSNKGMVITLISLIISLVLILLYIKSKNKNCASCSA